jgi:hypothetical protein
MTYGCFLMIYGYFNLYVLQFKKRMKKHKMRGNANSCLVQDIV